MAEAAIDWSALRGSAIGAASAVLVALGLSVASTFFASRMEDRYRTRDAERVSAREHYLSTEREAEMMKILGLYDLMKSHLR